MAVIDAHQHLWDLERSPYAWLGSPGLEAIHRSIPFADGIPHLDAAGVDGSVLVQADDTDGDTDAMLEAASSDPRAIGVVGWAPLDDPARAEARLRAIASPALVGVRALIHDMPDPDWILRPDVDEGLGVLERLDLAFDYVAVLPRHLENLVSVGERHPGLRIVVDHLAKPPIGLADREPWWTLIARAAENPRVVGKLSGLYSAAGEVASWTVDQIGPFVDRGLDVFGPERLMYGGDWPFSIPAGDYPRTWEAITHHLGRLGERDRAEILGGTAIRHYRLDLARVAAAVAARSGA
jgi:L-fuconolactonase